MPYSRFEPVTLVASAASTATSTGTTAVELLTRFGGGTPAVPLTAIAFVLDVTAAATEVGDTLDVYVQTKLDGTNWVDVVHFTQILGNGSTKRVFAKIEPPTAMTAFENGTALGAAAVRALFGTQWRCRWVVVDGNANASFTFSVVAIPQ